MAVPMNQLPVETWQGSCDGPKGVLAEIARGAASWGLDFKVNYHERRWFSETATYSITGTVYRLRQFQKAVRQFEKDNQ